MELSYAAFSHRGMRKQQDRFYANPARGVFVVADGVGSLRNSEKAAQHVVDVFRFAYEPENRAGIDVAISDDDAEMLDHADGRSLRSVVETARRSFRTVYGKERDMDCTFLAVELLNTVKAAEISSVYAGDVLLFDLCRQGAIVYKKGAGGVVARLCPGGP